MSQYSIYDKELNECSKYKYSLEEIIGFVRVVFENESDRASFYEFEDENGNKYDCWDIQRMKGE